MDGCGTGLGLERHGSEAEDLGAWGL
uniref:Uncharacterized protein n=1 Tax=Arundo donax TaxID=35708 RepID=A0A0A9GIK6_ARUDO